MSQKHVQKRSRTFISELFALSAHISLCTLGLSSWWIVSEAIIRAHLFPWSKHRFGPLNCISPRSVVHSSAIYLSQTSFKRIFIVINFWIYCIQRTYTVRFQHRRCGPLHSMTLIPSVSHGIPRWFAIISMFEVQCRHMDCWAEHRYDYVTSNHRICHMNHRKWNGENQTCADPSWWRT